MHENTDFTDRLWNFVHGTPDPGLEHHLASCPDCQEQQRVLEGLSALRAVEDTPPVPDTLSRSLTGLLSKVRPDLVRQPAEAQTPGKRLATIIAELIQDTAGKPQIVGLRGESRTRQLAFTSDVADLDLEVSPVNNEFLIVGQLGMDEIPDNLKIRFVPAESDPIDKHADDGNQCELTEYGYFRMNLAPGDWVIAVDIDDAVVLFPGIQL